MDVLVQVTHPILGVLDTKFQPDFGTYKEETGWRIFGYWFSEDETKPVRADIPVDEDVLIQLNKDEK